jgi:hypothetical protein
LSGYCYIDNDGDGYTGSSGTAYCRATASKGTDCNDSCATCYPGSTVWTRSPDGLDEDCNGVVDDTTTIQEDYGYDGGNCNWKPEALGGIYKYEQGYTYPPSGFSCNSTVYSNSTVNGFPMISAAANCSGWATGYGANTGSTVLKWTCNTTIYR